MPQEPVWVRDDVVLAIHRRQLAENGGSDGVRDPGLLSSALARPRNLLAYGEPAPDLPALAAAYAYGIVRNHPFVDGNKRTGYVVCRTFLLINGQDIDASQQEKYLTFLHLAEGSLEEEALSGWIRSHLSTRSQ
jgi:death-on-curing protein